MSDSEDDGVPQLSSHTLAALREFYAEQQQQQHADPSGEDRYNIGVIEEDWVCVCAGLSQLAPRLCHLHTGASGLRGGCVKGHPCRFCWFCSQAGG